MKVYAVYYAVITFYYQSQAKNVNVRLPKNLD